MEDKNKPIVDGLIKTAFPNIKFLNYNITAYSLNTKFSFKFKNLSHFIDFLHQHQSISEGNRKLLNHLLQESNIEPNSFFYINFFENPLEKEF